MQRIGSIIMAGLTASVIGAMGCTGDQNSNPPDSDQTGSVYERVGEAYEGHTGIGPSPGPIGQVGKWIKKHLPGGGSSGSGGSTGAGGSFLTFLALGLLIGGGILSRKHIWRWGLPLLAAGLVLTGWQLGFAFGIAQWWKPIVLIWIVVWAIALKTKFKGDDKIIFGGSLVLLALTILGKAIPLLGPGGWIEGAPSITWGIFQFLGVFAIAPGVWSEPRFGTNTVLKYLVLAGALWVPLLLTH